MGKFKEDKEIMTESRIYTIRGQNPAAATHKKIQLSRFDPTEQYEILEFKIMPAGTGFGAATNSDCYGTISMGKNDNIDPTDPDFTNQNEIAWTHHSVMQRVPPGIVEGIQISNYEVNDSKIFAYDIWMHTTDRLLGSGVNWFLKIKRYKTTEVSGSIASLRQNQYNDQENQ